MKVLVIPEDPTLDQFILLPVVTRIFEDVRRQARVEVLRDPHLRGIDQALSAKTIGQIIEDNPMVDLFIVIADRDCDRFRNAERAGALRSALGARLLVCLAVHEVEVWMLALFDHAVAWQAIRTECDPKERFAAPFLESRGWAGEVGRGRKRAMRAIAGNWSRLLSRCPELKDLSSQIAALAQH